ncbi:MAG: hypothetical protein MRT15_10975 [archaeon YNP-LCB-003-016]|uniref:hypothetical protein n=1 Tax=Candidatus Culexarchaeum yellowstonense TaxID=2928963 RepID=UPI0026EC8D4D|nr:hypothetical protein [Candidatus Culexarchaeum yellowstonense]MCR6692905.1 hypothetical protein [Candidatus Culexarchaeum yellowstonense]
MGNQKLNVELNSWLYAKLEEISRRLRMDKDKAAVYLMELGIRKYLELKRRKI